MGKKKMKKIYKKRDALFIELKRLNDFKEQVQKEFGYVEERRMTIKRDFKEVQKKIDKIHKKIRKIEEYKSDSGMNKCYATPY